MNDIIATALTTSSIMTAVGGAITYFVKRNFELVMDKKLKEQSMIFEKEMNQFNSQLERKSKEQFLVFQTLHQERAELIKSLFKSIISVQRSYEGILLAEIGRYEIEENPPVDDDTIQHWKKEYGDKIINLMTTHEENRYYLSEKLSSKFEAFVEKLNIIHEEEVKLQQDLYESEIEYEFYLGELKALLQRSKELFLPIIKDIENEFRTLIGANNE